MGKFFASFGDPIIKILLAALGLNMLFMLKNFDVFEAVGIVVAILTATLVSTVSEYGSEKAFEKLREESENVRCRVIRNSQPTLVRESELVVGDIVLLSAGDRVPADGKLFSGALLADMSALNGESKEIKKYPLGAYPSGDKTDSPDVLLRGTAITRGQGMMKVMAVGSATVYGRLAGELSVQTRTSPLKLKLSRLAMQISRIGYGAAAAVCLAYLFNAICVDASFVPSLMLARLADWHFMARHLLRALTLAITIIVVAVPEGLPMMITVVLSSNMKRMLADNIMVRKLVGIETAGAMNVLFCDKTGTLTTGEQRVQCVVNGRGMVYDKPSEWNVNPFLSRSLMLQGNFNCEAKLNMSKVVGGNATDRAFAKSFARNGEMGSARLLELVPFDSVKKYSAAVIEEDGRKRVLIKGAPEIILSGVKKIYGENGEITASFDKELLFKRLRQMTEKAQRVIALAEAEYLPADMASGELTFLCFVGIRDKIRRDAARSVEKLKTAGISVIMVTGDNKETATAVAKECSVIGKYENSLVLTGKELESMTDDEIASVLPRLSVVARALPSDKSRLVKIAQRLDLVAGMTGDGVNDAPALKIADVGFAMGNGTEVAKEAGDIVMLDNSLSYIVRTVIYGRTIFKSIRKFIVFQLTMNMCAVGISLIGPFVGIDTPITVIQMLWINIIMDTLGGLAFAGEAPDEEYLKEKPKHRRENLVNGYMAKQIAFSCLVTLGVCLFFMMTPWVRAYFEYSLDSVYFMSGFFCLFIFLGIANCFMARTPRINITSRLSRNKPFILIMMGVGLIQLAMIYFGRSVFRTEALALSHLMFVFSLVALSVLVQLIGRILMRITGKNSSNY